MQYICVAISSVRLMRRNWKESLTSQNEEELVIRND